MNLPKMNLAVFGVIGIIIVLSLMILYSRFNKTNLIISSPAFPKITVSNEFVPNMQNVTASPNNFVFQVTSPANKSIVKTSTVSITGKTVSDADVYVNEIDTKADTQGNFSVKYNLEEGENYIVVGANDSLGNNSEMELILTYAP